jgi:hypothetical protein
MVTGLMNPVFDGPLFFFSSPIGGGEVWVLLVLRAEQGHEDQSQDACQLFVNLHFTSTVEAG